jgi:hypothetical protein
MARCSRDRDRSNTVSSPTVGRIVHYKSYGTPGGEYGPECRAAVVTEVIDAENVGLAVLNPTGMFFNSPIEQDEDQTEGGGTWHWPCVRSES